MESIRTDDMPINHILSESMFSPYRSRCVISFNSFALFTPTSNEAFLRMKWVQPNLSLLVFMDLKSIRRKPDFRLPSGKGFGFALFEIYSTKTLQESKHFTQRKNAVTKKMPDSAVFGAHFCKFGFMLKLRGFTATSDRQFVGAVHSSYNPCTVQMGQTVR